MIAYLEITPAASPLISTIDAKAFLRVDHADEDALINSLIAAATARLDGPEGILGRALVSQEWRLSWPCVPYCSRFILPISPLISIEAIKTVIDGVETVFDSANYTVTAAGDLAAIDLKDGVVWPDADDLADAFRIEATFGSATAELVPAPLRTAALLLLGHLYDNRSAVVVGPAASALPLSVEALIAPYRRFTQ